MSICYFRIPTTADFEYQATSLFLKNLAFSFSINHRKGQTTKKPDRPARVPITTIPLTGNKGHASPYEARMARGAMRRAIKAADKAKRLAARNLFHKYEDIKDEH